MSKDEVKQTILRLYQASGMFPTIAALAAALHCTESEVRPLLQQLLKEGWLVKRGNWTRLAEQPGHVVAGRVDASQATDHNGTTHSKFASPAGEAPLNGNSAAAAAGPIEAEPPTEDSSASAPVPLHQPDQVSSPSVSGPPGASESPAAPFLPARGKRDWTTLILRAVMVVIGTGAAVMSAYYTTIWLLEFLPGLLAGLLGGIMVGFSVAAFETILIFGHNKQWAAVGAFVLIWLVVAAFSITSTIAGQYNQHVRAVVKESSSNLDVSATRLRLQSIRDRRAELQATIKTKQEQLATLNGILGSVTSIESRAQFGRSWADTQYKADQLDRQLTDLQKQVDQTRTDEAALLAESPEIAAAPEVLDIPNFYSWLAGVLKISKDSAQFWLSLFPAIFIDIIAPAALAVAMFLTRKEK